MDAEQAIVDDCVRRALLEDLGSSQLDPDADVTSRLSVSADLRAHARITAKARGVIAGLDCAVAAFSMLDPTSQTVCHRRDGDAVKPGDLVLEVSARMRSLLASERTALNFLQRLSGIATVTAQFVAAVKGLPTKILDTRKTTPGLRVLEKRAVVAGGGTNHRIGLYDQVLLKENHFACAKPLPYAEVVRRCVAAHPAPVVAEAQTEAEAVAAVDGGDSVVLLDNFPPGPSLQDAVRAVRAAAAKKCGKVAIEASGGVRLDNVRAYAECGVDRVSIGALTHSAPALDLSMLVEERR